MWVVGRELAAGNEFGQAEEFLHRGRPDLAEVCMQRAIASAPLNSRYQALAGDIAGSMQKFDKAVSHYQAAVRNDPLRAAYHWHLAQAEVAARGVTAAAVAEFGRAAELYPSNQRYQADFLAAKESVGQGAGGLLRSVPARQP